MATLCSSPWLWLWGREGTAGAGLLQRRGGGPVAALCVSSIPWTGPFIKYDKNELEQRHDPRTCGAVRLSQWFLSAHSACPLTSPDPGRAWGSTSGPEPCVHPRHVPAAIVFLLQVNVIHTASPVEHASHMAAQPQFVHPEHRSFVDLSGHNLASPHPFAGRTVGRSPDLREALGGHPPCPEPSPSLP